MHFEISTEPRLGNSSGKQLCRIGARGASDTQLVPCQRTRIVEAKFMPAGQLSNRRRPHPRDITNGSRFAGATQHNGRSIERRGDIP